MTFLTRFDRWDPLEELTAMRGRMDSLWSRVTAGEPPVLADWAPTSDVIESNEEITIKAELPGVDAKDVEVQIENGLLTIRGERKGEKETEEKGYRRVERAYGSFLRSYQLPQNAEPEKIGASLENGLLEVHVPKRQGVEPRTIKLEVKPAAVASKEVTANERPAKEMTAKEVKPKEVLEPATV